MNLTQEQQQIIDLGFEHCVITAVAGSGKTTTLAHRICRLLIEGHDPERMLILMFNKSAKQDFEKKLPEVLALKQASQTAQKTRFALPEIRTYHAMGYRLYRRFIQETFLPPIHPEVLTEQEVQYQVWQLLRKAVPENERSELNRNKKEYVESAISFIELVKTTLRSAEEVYELNSETFKRPLVIKIFHLFEQWRKEHARISFSDMLWEPVKLIHQHPGLLKMVTNKMDLILVDEYQDTNEIQHRLLTYIAGERARVTVVGDPDQTIYEFRGAQPDFILRRFAEDFPSPTELTLSYSFRYGHRVALLANHLIHHNRGRKNVLCHAHSDVMETHCTLEPGQNASDVLALTQRYLADQRSPAEIAILCRVWSQTVEIELALLNAGIPYYSGENKGALASRELKGLLILLEYACDQFMHLTQTEQQNRYRELLRFPHCGLKDEQVTDLSQWLSRSGSSTLSVDQWPVLERLGNLQKHRIKRFIAALSQLARDSKHFPSAQLLSDYVKQTDMLNQLRSASFTYDSGEERVNTLQGFINYIRTLRSTPTETIVHFNRLKHQARAVKASQGVNLTTIHRAKGLEWPIVLLPGLTDALMPYHHKDEPITPLLLESERRLLYVAMTRVREALHLFAPPGAADNQSRFIGEMQVEASLWLANALYAHTDATAVKVPPALAPLSPICERYCARERITLEQPSLSARLMSRITGGQRTGKERGPTRTECPLWKQDRVHHAIFGEGQVTQELERSFSVRFTTGKEMEFSKKSAHLYFKQVDTHAS